MKTRSEGVWVGSWSRSVQMLQNPPTTVTTRLKCIAPTLPMNSWEY